MKIETEWQPVLPTAVLGPSRGALDCLALRQFVLDMVSLVFRVEPNRLSAPTRGRRDAAHARQVAMYLVHVGGGLSLSDVGRLFGRDRTTVAHACARIEDGRDDELFDRTLAHLERAIAQRMGMAREGWDGC